MQQFCEQLNLRKFTVSGELRSHFHMSDVLTLTVIQCLDFAPLSPGVVVLLCSLTLIWDSSLARPTSGSAVPRVALLYQELY